MNEVAITHIDQFAEAARTAVHAGKPDVAAGCLMLGAQLLDESVAQPPKTVVDAFNKALWRAYDGEADSPKLNFTTISHCDVTLHSREAVLHELNLMAQCVEHLTFPDRVLIEWVLCDSKACATYQIKARSDDPAVHQRLAEHWRDALRTLNTGYNGIHCGETYFEAEWYEDEALAELAAP